MELADRLNVVKLRTKNCLVDDLDYFPFPKKYLENLLIKKSEEELELDSNMSRLHRKKLL
jgi:hypothetical protein